MKRKNGYEKTVIFREPLEHKCNYSWMKPNKKALGYHGDTILFADGKIGRRLSWTPIDGVISLSKRPNVIVGDVLKSLDGSFEGLVSQVIKCKGLYYTKVGSRKYSNRQLQKVFGVEIKTASDNEKIELGKFLDLIDEYKEKGLN